MNLKVFTVFLFILLSSQKIWAHESRPLYISIVQQDSSTLDLTINIPGSVAPNNLPVLVIPNNFTENANHAVLQNTSSGYLESRKFNTDGHEIKGQNLSIEYPVYNPSITTIFQIEFLDGTTQTHVLGPQESEIYVAEDPSQWKVIRDYGVLGIEHIWAGIDHLLFLLCLLIVAGFSRKLFWTITGFTLAHSITLILSTLGWITLLIQPVEACIALSIIFLCYEIVHHHSTQSSLTYQYPVLVSSSFGLLHGFGFASVLKDIGLPDKNLVEALLFFNVGVEIGQLMFITTIAFAYFLIYRTTLSMMKRDTSPAFLLTIFTYSIGILASCWFFDRLF